MTKKIPEMNGLTLPFKVKLSRMADIVEIDVSTAGEGSIVVTTSGGYKYSSNNWDMEFIKEENMTAKVSIEDIKAGQTITVTMKDIEVSSVDKAEGVVYASGGRKFRIARPEYSSSWSKYNLYEATIQKASNPEHWPPQKGDVWEDNAVEYHILSDGSWSGKVFAYSPAGAKNNICILKPDGKLKYRKGNSLK